MLSKTWILNFHRSPRLRESHLELLWWTCVRSFSPISWKLAVAIHRSHLTVLTKTGRIFPWKQKRFLRSDAESSSQNGGWRPWSPFLTRSQMSTSLPKRKKRSMLVSGTRLSNSVVLTVVEQKPGLMVGSISCVPTLAIQSQWNVTNSVLLMTPKPVMQSRGWTQYDLIRWYNRWVFRALTLQISRLVSRVPQSHGTTLAIRSISHSKPAS